MAKRLGTLVFTASVCALTCLVACSEGSDSAADDSTGGSSNSGGSETGGGDTGGGDTGGGNTGGGDTGGSATGGGGGSTSSVKFGFDSDLGDLKIDYEENFAGQGGAFNSTLSLNSTDGEPEPGSAEVTIPFDFTGTGSTDTLQKVHLAIPFEGEGTDLSGKTVSVNIKLVSGGSADAACPMNGKLFVKTTADWIWGDGGTVDLVLGEWVPATMEVSFASYQDTGYDPSVARSLGVEISPNSSNGCLTEDTVVLIDSFAY